MDTSKKDLYYIIAIAAIILIAIVTYWLGGKGNEIVSYISFASAVVSIILALVAIFYSFVQNVNSQQNIGEMKNLVAEASQIMTEKAETLTEQAVSIGKIVEQFNKQKITVSSTTTTPSHEDLFRFDSTHSSIPFLLTMYYMVNCYKNKKPMRITNIAKFTFRTESGKPDLLVSMMFGFGVIQCLISFLEPESIIMKGIEIEIKKLPSSLEQNILTTLERQIEDETSVAAKAVMQGALAYINSQFENV